MQLDTEWLNKALNAITSGVCDKLEKGNIKVYKVGAGLIRIDIKEE